MAKDPTRRIARQRTKKAPPETLAPLASAEAIPTPAPVAAPPAPAPESPPLKSPVNPVLAQWAQETKTSGRSAISTVSALSLAREILTREEIIILSEAYGQQLAWDDVAGRHGTSQAMIMAVGMRALEKCLA